MIYRVMLDAIEKVQTLRLYHLWTLLHDGQKDHVGAPDTVVDGVTVAQGNEHTDTNYYMCYKLTLHQCVWTLQKSSAMFIENQCNVHETSDKVH